jgi:hypothetical protein
MKRQRGSLEDRIETAIRLPPAEGAPDAGVMDLLASIRVLFDGQFLPLASQIQLFQYVIEEHVQRKLRVRPPAAHAQVRQDKFPEPLEVQFRRNALPVLTFRHPRPREKETVGLLRWRDPNGTIPRSCGRIRPFWKPATSNKQIVGALTTGNPARVAAKAVIVTEVERLRWRIWNGKAKNARKSIIRIRAVMHHFRGEPGSRKSVAPSRKLWTALHALDGYLTGQSAWLVNYAERHRAGLRVGTAITEGTANFLVNRRMNKSQQMRWSRRGADLLLQVRCAVYNGTLGFDFGQKFYPANDVSPPTAVAA